MPVASVTFSNDGKLMAVSYPGRMYLMDALEGTVKAVFDNGVDPNTGAALEASFSPDSRYLISGEACTQKVAWAIHVLPAWNPNIGPALVASCFQTPATRSEARRASDQCLRTRYLCPKMARSEASACKERFLATLWRVVPPFLGVAAQVQ